MKYAGIGSRDTKEPHLTQMAMLAAELGLRGWTLRSGGAIGADQAFEKGCDSVGGKKEIFLSNYPSTKEAWDLAAKIHPNWPAVLKKGAGNIMARNGHQILGANLDDPVDFIICWTEGGKLKGGTAQAMRIALRNNIPIFNLGSHPIQEIKNRIWEATTDGLSPCRCDYYSKGDALSCLNGYNRRFTWERSKALDKCECVCHNGT